MPARSILIGTYRQPVLGSDGLPVLQAPAGWRGPILERLSIPTTSECGPQFTGMPVICTSRLVTGQRWYKHGTAVRDIPTPPFGIDMLNAGYEREYERWECGPGCDTLCMRLHPSVVERYLHEDAHRFDFDVRFAHIDEVLARQIFMLAEEFQGHLPNGSLYAEGLAMMIFGWLKQHYTFHRAAGPTLRGMLSSGQQHRVREFIDAGLGSELTLESIANAIGMSPYHFLRRFRTAFGTTPHQYVLHARLARAAHMLRAEPQRTISDVALSTGFASHAHFSSAFKRHFGQTPAQWRSAI